MDRLRKAHLIEPDEVSDHRVYVVASPVPSLADRLGAVCVDVVAPERWEEALPLLEGLWLHGQAEVVVISLEPDRDDDAAEERRRSLAAVLIERGCAARIARRAGIDQFEREVVHPVIRTADLHASPASGIYQPEYYHALVSALLHPALTPSEKVVLCVTWIETARFPGVPYHGYDLVPRTLARIARLANLSEGTTSRTLGRLADIKLLKKDSKQIRRDFRELSLGAGRLPHKDEAFPDAAHRVKDRVRHRCPTCKGDKLDPYTFMCRDCGDINPAAACGRGPRKRAGATTRPSRATGGARAVAAHTEANGPASEKRSDDTGTVEYTGVGLLEDSSTSGTGVDPSGRLSSAIADSASTTDGVTRRSDSLLDADCIRTLSADSARTREVLDGLTAADHDPYPGYGDPWWADLDDNGEESYQDVFSQA